MSSLTSSVYFSAGDESVKSLDPNSTWDSLDSAQEALEIKDARNEELLETVSASEAPKVRLKVDIIEAKDLESKHPDGLTDPFVSMHITSMPTHRCNTSVKADTIHPKWDEQFSLPISDNPHLERLVVEVYDEKNKFIKQVSGLRKLITGIGVSANKTKRDSKLIGRTTVCLEGMPAAGSTMWYNFDKKNRLESRGKIKIGLVFSTRTAIQEHRYLLYSLLMHELDASKVAPYCWSGALSTLGESKLAQHSAQCGLSTTEVAIVKWSVYACVHNNRPLAFSVFAALLDELIRPVQDSLISEDKKQLFWNSTQKLLPSCFAVVQKFDKETTNDKNLLVDVLNIWSKIARLHPPEDMDVLPKSNRNKRDDDGVHGTLLRAVKAGSADCWKHIKETASCPVITEEDKLQHIRKLIELVLLDLQRCMDYDKIFQETINFQYARTLHSLYEAALTEYAKPIVLHIIKTMKRIGIAENESQEMKLGTILFELYLDLKRFTGLGADLSPGETSYRIPQYHNWFKSVVTHWLDMSVHRVLMRIGKAIESDRLEPVADSVKYSFSAVDTLDMFNQTKIFWQQLAWPDESVYLFGSKCLYDISQCLVFYADKLLVRVEGYRKAQNVNDNEFEVTQEWCLAINNIDYILQNLELFVKELCMDIQSKLADYRSPMEAQRYNDALVNVIEQAMVTTRNKFLELINRLVKKMASRISRLLAERGEFLQKDSNSLELLMMYLEKSLTTLHRDLNEGGFDRVLDAIWNELTTIMRQFVQSNLEKRRLPSFFRNLNEALRVMIKCFRTDNNDGDPDREDLHRILEILDLHSLESADLIHKYYLGRLGEQKKMNETPYGQLTVRCAINDDNVLELEIINARSLRPAAYESCYPFVRIHFLHKPAFSSVAKLKTAAQSKTLFPLFEQKFAIKLTGDQLGDSLILFSVKDRNYLGISNKYNAETLISLQEILNWHASEQIHLTLTRPNNLDSNVLRTLELRQFDKQAKEFLSKLKKKVNLQARIKMASE